MKSSVVLMLMFVLASCVTFKTHPLPSNDFLTLCEVRDTSYLATRPVAHFNTQFWNDRDSALHAVEMDSVYSRPLFDLDSNRSLDSLGLIPRSRYRILKSSTAAIYQILKAR